jgi:hypothetical protein
MDATAANRTLEHAFRLWFKPELDRRAADGRIRKGFAVWAVQVVLNLDAEPEVRINHEVKGAFIGRPKKKATVGQTMRLSDFTHIESMTLTDEDPNAGLHSADPPGTLAFVLRFPLQRTPDREAVGSSR